MYITGQMKRAVKAYFKAQGRRSVHQIAIAFGVEEVKLESAIKGAEQ